MSAINSQPLPPVWERPAQGGHFAVPSVDLNGLWNTMLQSLKNTIATLPIVSSSISIMCLGFYFIQLILWIITKLPNSILDPSWGFFGQEYFSLNPSLVVNGLQFWRIFTYPYFHIGVFHVLFNLLATIPISLHFEKRVGSVQYFLLLNTVFVIGPALTYCALRMIPLPMFASLPPIVGLSGLFFTLLVWQVKEAPYTSFCGLCDVPSLLYPILLLLVISIIFPSASFFGHLLGLLFGYLYVFNFLKWAELKEENLIRIEYLSPILALSRTFPNRFVGTQSRTFGASEPTDLPFFSSQGQTIGSNSNPMPNSGSGYHIPFFQNEATPSGTGNSSSQPPPLFQGQGHRLGD